MTKEQEIESCLKSAAICRQTAKKHQREADGWLAKVKHWNEAADNAEKKAAELKKEKD